MSAEISSAILRVLPNTIAFVIVGLLLLKKKITREQIDLIAPNHKRIIVPVYFGFLLYMLAEEFLSNHFGFFEISAWQHGAAATVIRLIGAIVIAPIIEEILFRGFIINAFSKKIGIHAAVFAQALFFQLCHSASFSLEPSALYYSVFGILDAIIYGYVRVYFKSLYPGILMHASGNTVSILERFIFGSN